MFTALAVFRRVITIPHMPRPKSARVVGSGTVVAGNSGKDGEKEAGFVRPAAPTVTYPDATRSEEELFLTSLWPRLDLAC
jgi:hypothetical protein